jgi:hypothetical protein
MGIAVDDGLQANDVDRVLLSAFLNGQVVDIDRSLVLKRDNPRLFKTRERLDSAISRIPEATLSGAQKRAFREEFCIPYLDQVRGCRDTFENLLSSNLGTIGKFKRIWRAVDTCLQLGVDEDHTHEVKRFKCKWWRRIAMSVIKHDSYHYAAKDWKNFQKFLYLHYGGSIQPIPEWNDEWPPLPTIGWMSRGTLSRVEYAKWSWLISGRALPHGDLITAGESLKKHTAALCFQEPPSDSDLRELEVISHQAGEAVSRHVPREFWGDTTGHLSISGSACLEMSRTHGGRRAYVLNHLRDWLNEVPSEDRVVTLPTGEAFVEVAGKSRHQTVRPPLMPEAPPPDERKKVDDGLLTESFSDQEQQRTAFQLFSWSFITLRDEGFLDGMGYPTGKPMPVEREAIGEPGLKVRIVTKSKAAFITYGQSAAHFVNGLLWYDPSLRAGLKAGNQGFEWLKQFEPGEVLPKHIMVGDFETSTDFIKHESAITMMEALFDEMKINSHYVRGYFQLLLSSRIFESEDGDILITSAGSLMGEPGTKSVLTFAAKVANVKARPSKRGYFATAGDDQIDADDNPTELLNYAEASRITSMIPSTDKWAIMTKAVIYCQELILVGETRNRAKVDVPKLRLCSPEQKQKLGDDDTNPSYGKAREIRTIANWIIRDDPDNQGILAHFVARFLRNMCRYIEYKPELFLPMEWGGLGLPLVGSHVLWPRLPDWKKSLILEREAGEPAADRILRQWGQPVILDRGRDSDGEALAYDAYMSLLDCVPTIQTQELREKFPEETTFPALKSLARSHGIMTKEDIVDTVIKSQAYQQFWNPKTEITRGFKSVSWDTRDQRLKRQFSECFEIRTDLQMPVGSPAWKPAEFVDTRAEWPLETESDGVKQVPLMGQVQIGPRLFTHQSNMRLGRCGSSTPAPSDQRTACDYRNVSPLRKRRRQSL